MAESIRFKVHTWLADHFNGIQYPRHWARLSIGLAMALACAHADAQMFLCTDEHGHKTLRNYACEQNEKHQLIIKIEEPSYFVIESTGETTVFNQPPSSVAAAPSANTSPADGGDGQLQRIAQAREDQHNLAMSKTGLREQQIKEIRQRIALRNEIADPNTSPHHRQLLIELLREMPDSAPRDMAKAPSGQESVWGESETPTTIEPPVIIAPPSLSVITNCDSGGCWDNLGNRYNGDTTGTTLIGPSGACQKIGDMMQCP